MGFLDIGIDLGTTKTIIYKKDEGILLNEPSVVAMDIRTNEIIAIGNEAFAMVGKTPPNITTIFPLKDGVISDHVATQDMVRYFIQKVSRSFMIKHRVAICVPSKITDVDKNAITKVVINAGGRKAFLVEEPIAAAIGIGIKIENPEGNMIVDIGGGTTDIAVISMADIVTSKSIKYAGNKIDQELIRLIQSKFQLQIGASTATKMKHTLSQAMTPDKNISCTVKGLNFATGLPQNIEVNQHDIYECIEQFANIVSSGIKEVLENTPPELVGDIYTNGIYITGGGALIGGLGNYVTQTTSIDVNIPDNTIDCVAIGTNKAFKYISDGTGMFASVTAYS